MLNQQTSSTGQLQSCIEQCLDCHSICLETVMHCLEKGGPHAEPDHIRLLLDCAEICQTSANFMLRGSELYTLTCEVCAETCEQCGDSCEQFENDPHMQACAQTCRSCADACQAIAEEAGVE